MYIWHDRRHRKFYIGCHWGTEDDGYICSSRWMRQSYKRRSEDFKRKIISKVYTNRQDLLEEEYKWLSLIKDEELGKRYYNLSKKHFGHWTVDPEKRLKIIEIIKKNHIPGKWSEERRKNASEMMKNNTYAIGNTFRKGSHHTDEAKQKMSLSHIGKNVWHSGKTGIYSEETIKKMSDAKKGKSPINKGKYSINKPRVSFHKQLNKWRVRIHKEGKEIHLGLFSTIEEANKYIIEINKEQTGTEL